jgi:hypothetical protein
LEDSRYASQPKNIRGEYGGDVCELWNSAALRQQPENPRAASLLSVRALMGAQESLPHDTETPAQRLDALLAGAHIGGEFNNRGPNPKASLTLAEALTCAFFVGTIASSFIDVNETHAVGINVLPPLKPLITGRNAEHDRNSYDCDRE